MNVSLLRGMCSLEMLMKILNYFDKTLMKVFLPSTLVTWVGGLVSQCFSWIPLGDSPLAAQWWRCKPLFIQFWWLVQRWGHSQNAECWIQFSFWMEDLEHMHYPSVAFLPTILPHPFLHPLPKKSQQTNKQTAPKPEQHNPSHFPLLSELIVFSH